MQGRGKRVAMGAGVLGIVVIIAPGIALKDWIREEWWLSRLEHGDEACQKLSAEKLGELGTVRAAPVLVQQMLRSVRPVPFGIDGQIFYGFEIPDITFRDALVRIGGEAVPALMEAVDKDDDRTLACVDTAEIICMGGMELLCRDGDRFKRRLQRLLDQQPLSPATRRAVAEALRKIAAADADSPR